MNKVSLEEVRRQTMINKATVISEFLKDSLDCSSMDAKDGEYDYFPEDFSVLDTNVIDCYLEAYRNMIPNLYEDFEESFSDLVKSLKATFSHEVSFTTGSTREGVHALEG